MDFYTNRHPTDPEWVARAALFHGHLGPWLIVGAMIGQDAVRRLESLGHWKIDVTCWMPPDKQRTPFSCLLDGLQVSSGATLGKQNIRFDHAPDVLADGWPVVQVVRLQDSQRPSAGVTYRATDCLHERLQQITPERLEDGSRELARSAVEALFEVRAMTDAELSRCRRDR